jgi:hypothetical protein
VVKQLKKNSGPNEASSVLNDRRGRAIPMAVLMIFVVVLSMGSGIYASASYFAPQASSVTVTTTIYTTTTSWTTSTLWSTVTSVVYGVWTAVQYTTSTSTVTVTGSPTSHTAYTGGASATGIPVIGYAYAYPIALSGSGSIQSIGINWAGGQSGNVMVALYSAGSGKPANLLTQSASTAMTQAAGWQDIPVTAYSFTAGTYWLAIQLSSGKSLYYQHGSRSYYAKGYGPFDSAWSPSSGQDSAAQWNMRVTYIASV